MDKLLMPYVWDLSGSTTEQVKKTEVGNMIHIAESMTPAVFQNKENVFLFAFSSEREAPTACVIEINGEEFARYDLPAITGEKVIEIDNEYGRNTIIIDKNGAAVTHSNCADKYEVKAGKITSSGQSLICLPHRLTVRLEGAEKSDGIAW